MAAREILIAVEPKHVITGMDQDSHTEIEFMVTLTDTEGIEVVTRQQVAVGEDTTLSIRIGPDGLLTKETNASKGNPAVEE